MTVIFLKINSQFKLQQKNICTFFTFIAEHVAAQNPCCKTKRNEISYKNFFLKNIGFCLVYCWLYNMLNMLGHNFVPPYVFVVACVVSQKNQPSIFQLLQINDLTDTRNSISTSSSPHSAAASPKRVAATLWAPDIKTILNDAPHLAHSAGWAQRVRTNTWENCVAPRSQRRRQRRLRVCNATINHRRCMTGPGTVARLHTEG